MNMIEQMQFSLARMHFNRQRERFYIDLSGAIQDGEKIYTFLTRLRKFCEQYKYRGLALLYGVMIKRSHNEEGKISHMLKTIVPDDDMVSLAVIDSADDDKKRSAGFLRLAEHIKRKKSIGNALLKSMLTTIFLLPVIVGMAIVNTKKIPVYDRMIADRSKWPEISQLLGWTADVTTSHWVTLLITAAILCVGLLCAFRFWTGRLRAKFDRFIPFSLYRDVKSTEFLMDMAGLLGNEKKLVPSLNLLRANAAPWLKFHIASILTSLDKYPNDYARAFDTGLFSPAVHLRLITYGARDTNFAAAFVRLGTDAIEDVKEETGKTAARLRVTTVAISIGILAFFYLGDFYTRFAINDLIQMEMQERNNS